MKRLGIILLITCSLFAGAAALAFASLEKSLDIKVKEVELIKLEQKRIVLRQVQKLQEANPAQDFAKAWAEQDYRFIGVYGHLYFVPGVSKDEANASLRRKRVNFIKGTGGGMDTSEEKRLHTLAVDYATRYNKLLLKSVKSRSSVNNKS